MSQSTSHSKGAAPEGQIKGPQSRGAFQNAASPSASQHAQGKSADVAPAPQQAHNMKGPGGASVTKAAQEQKMARFHADQKAADQVKARKQKADSIAARDQSKARDKIKGKDDLQK